MTNALNMVAVPLPMGRGVPPEGVVGATVGVEVDTGHSVLAMARDVESHMLANVWFCSGVLLIEANPGKDPSIGMAPSLVARVLKLSTRGWSNALNVKSRKY
mmetsp:Transcript_12652/g.26203  ORF Transcript_12652/g.26203 Transcript_12652/m.26203 type:complete len:102 (-) Transcript_12652:1468-1773(-)